MLPPLFADIIVIAETVSVVSIGISFLLHELNVTRRIINRRNMDLGDLFISRFVNICKIEVPKFTQGSDQYQTI
jgi:hypothetical protein